MRVALFRVCPDSILFNFPIFKGVARPSLAQIHKLLTLTIMMPDALQIQDLLILISHFSPTYKMLLTILVWSISSDKYSAFTLS